MGNNTAFRHELKYLINKRDMESCIRRIDRFTSVDKHAKDGVYFIRSLYFDDMYDTAYYDKENGVPSRHKFRVRSYNMEKGYIALEKKIKEGSCVKKDSAMLTDAEYSEIMAGHDEFLLQRSETVAHDFAIERRICGLKPVVIVDYERIPFVYEPGNVRITFDMNIRAVSGCFDIFCEDTASYNVFDRDRLVMEVKYTEFLPDIIRTVLPSEGCRLAVSKYVLCRNVANDRRLVGSL